jgi:hypothetical protein
VFRVVANTTGVDRHPDLRQPLGPPVSPPVNHRHVMQDDSEKRPRATSSRAHKVVEKRRPVGSRRAVDVGRVMKTLPVRFGARNMTRQRDAQILSNRVALFH